MLYGVASRCITPDRPVYLSGYGSRDEKSGGAYQDLFVRALALDSGDGPAVIVTSDLLYFDDSVLSSVENDLANDPGIEADRLIFTASHTHCGPGTRTADVGIFGTPDPEYVDEVRGALATVVRRALSGMSEGVLRAYRGACDIGINRRLTTPDGVQMRPNPAGPVDREVEILAIGSDARPVDAILVGFACHPTTMGGLLVGGDYPGFALRAIESAHPGATALFVQGCSGDVRPNNVDAAGAFRSGPLEVVESFGKRLGASVLEALESTARPVEGGLRIGSETVDLPLDPHPSREDLADALGDSSSVRREWARSILDAYSAGADLPTSIPVHVQALQIGDSLALVAISGEVCVEIGLRIKRLIGDRPRFVLGYANRVQWYIPSRTVRREGGYEADSFYYHGAPSPYDEAAEDILAETAERMLG